jgi:tRNA U54 and U55 pseudouridine synthase Pus10
MTVGSKAKRDILVELTTAKALTRHPCHVCGGCTEKVEVLVEVASGPMRACVCARPVLRLATLTRG